mmetsp:Transcript_22954/g.77039  ORF Transcript_22954/g.77039 Transcript_22954/m.77039 type:complete len:241 (-) Transcript_22954:76-798(-)
MSGTRCRWAAAWPSRPWPCTRTASMPRPFRSSSRRWPFTNATRQTTGPRSPRASTIWAPPTRSLGSGRRPSSTTTARSPCRGAPMSRGRMCAPNSAPCSPATATCRGRYWARANRSGRRPRRRPRVRRQGMPRRRRRRARRPEAGSLVQHAAARAWWRLRAACMELHAGVSLSPARPRWSKGGAERSGGGAGRDGALRGGAARPPALFAMAYAASSSSRPSAVDASVLRRDPPQGHRKCQ